MELHGTVRLKLNERRSTGQRWAVLYGVCAGVPRLLILKINGEYLYKKTKKRKNQKRSTKRAVCARALHQEDEMFTGSMPGLFVFQSGFHLK